MISKHKTTHTHTIDFLPYNGMKIDWLIDWLVFYVLSAIFQPYNGGQRTTAACSDKRLSTSWCRLFYNLGEYLCDYEKESFFLKSFHIEFNEMCNVQWFPNGPLLMQIWCNARIKNVQQASLYWQQYKW